jgi:hypothetical protein
MKRNPLTLTIGILLILIVALLLFVFKSGNPRWSSSPLRQSHPADQGPRRY